MTDSDETFNGVRTLVLEIQDELNLLFKELRAAYETRNESLALRISDQISFLSYELKNRLDYERKVGWQELLSSRIKF